ncbi:similar to Saccharomyces cerevisiae YOL023W IFM1 Mitochondrial translation initiation factor 2 [Maudiozyma saulgeensis]|uniref:Translation initiation factor IF-2, mitochondrial n=1 Tax=Maudiozyma saulgeensis TaxID=1789683 RepID=A0A1X7R142_9SACH|nr:similar to Saccharomyces cerevisiae YOL023W IFM1 Mitochondrial translation initiation factor 2 [Kazachstania saulgeensis]
MWKRSLLTISNRSYISLLVTQNSSYSRIISTTLHRNNRLIIQNNFRSYSKGYRRNKGITKNQKNEKPKKLTFTIPDYISVDKLSNLLNCRVQTVVKDLKNLGFKNITNDYIINKEYIELILQEYNYEIPSSTSSITSTNVYNELKDPLNPKLLESRPPIVTIMGHVDHGKTTIIDYLRKSSVVSQEHGGITQHIGAFQVTTPVSKKKITFLDTPGHAAFLKMRERGANITDIIVLVVSIEDSIMPQTKEAIKHIKNSGNQLIVAITKIDKIGNMKEREKKIEKVTNDLILNEIMVEKIGGDVQVIPISAKDGENMDLLEESIILLSDMMDIKTENSRNTMSEGFVIESEMKNTIGNVATILVRKGTLNNQSILLCGNTYCKVRSILGDAEKKVPKALPSQAVEVSGWKELPHVGDEFIQVKSEAIAKKYISKREALIEVEKNASRVDKLNDERYAESIRQKEAKNKDELDEDEDETTTTNVSIGPKLVNFIIKADVSGSAEAIEESIQDLGNEEVQCGVISSSVGVPTETDLKMAEISNSEILCFNLENLPNDVINNKHGVSVKKFNVIYKLIETVVEILENNMKKTFEKNIVATVDIKDIFEFNMKKKIIKIAGCKVNNGQINRNSKVQVVRGENKEIVYDGTLSSIKHGKDDISSASKGRECGITFNGNFEQFKAGDKILVYEEVEIPRHL